MYCSNPTARRLRFLVFWVGIDLCSKLTGYCSAAWLVWGPKPPATLEGRAPKVSGCGDPGGTGRYVASNVLNVFVATGYPGNTAVCDRRFSKGGPPEACRESARSKWSLPQTQNWSPYPPPSPFMLLSSIHSHSHPTNFLK